MPNLTFILIILLSFIPLLAHSLTLESDIEALRSVKRAIDPNSITPLSYLDSWDFGEDPCFNRGLFFGILCNFPEDNSTARVIEIDLDTVGYDGYLASSIGNLTELTVLSLRNNKFRGPIPKTISNLKKLTRLTLSNNFFTGSIPAGINMLTGVVTIDLSRNNLSNALPTNFSGLSSLTELILSRNRLVGRIPALDRLSQLNTLDLNNNQFSGNLPKLPINLTTLSLSDNMLNGRVSSIGALQRLVSLDLSNNNFTDVIPEEILALPEVVQVNLSFNQFTEIEVSTHTGTVTQLQVLDVQSNQLRGRLPINIVTIESLVSINLSNNQLSGRIPKEYGSKLERPWRNLFLDHNFLTGNPPPQFIAAKKARGSLARNCLNCPRNIPMCRGGQKRASECIRHKAGGYLSNMSQQ